MGFKSNMNFGFVFETDVETAGVLSCVMNETEVQCLTAEKIEQVFIASI